MSRNTKWVFPTGSGPNVLRGTIHGEDPVGSTHASLQPTKNMSSIATRSPSAASLAYAAYDAALTADLAAYDRCDTAGRAFDAARIALDAAREAFSAARKEREDAGAAADLSFAARNAAFKAWDTATAARKS